MPNILDAILGSLSTRLAARILLTFVFWSAGVAALFAFPERVAEMAHFGLQPAPLYAATTTVWLLLGSAMIILNRAAWLGAASLIVFTALTIPIAHAFWTMPKPERTAHFHVVMEHVSLVGALLAAAILCHDRKDR
jgi:transmembrane protein